jgi:hypothetical protein
VQSPSLLGHAGQRNSPAHLGCLMPTGPCADVARAAGSAGTVNSTARQTAREPLPEAA